MQPAMYKSLTDMADANSMMDLSQYFRLGKKQPSYSAKNSTEFEGSCKKSDFFLNYVTSVLTFSIRNRPV